MLLFVLKKNSRSLPATIMSITVSVSSSVVMSNADGVALPTRDKTNLVGSRVGKISWGGGEGGFRGFPLPTFRRGTSYIRPYYGEKSTRGLYTERIWAAIYKVFNNPCKKANVTYKSTYRVKRKGHTYLFEVWTYVLWEVLIKTLNVESQTLSFLFQRNVFKHNQ